MIDDRPPAVDRLPTLTEVLELVAGLAAVPAADGLIRDAHVQMAGILHELLAQAVTRALERRTKL